QPKWQAPQPTGPRPAPSPRPAASPPSVQNVLLVLGGVLLTIAALVFTLVSWRHLGITGRTLVLRAVTGAELAAPLPLLKRAPRSWRGPVPTRRRRAGRRAGAYAGSPRSARTAWAPGADGRPDR